MKHPLWVVEAGPKSVVRIYKMVAVPPEAGRIFAPKWAATLLFDVVAV